MVSHVNQQCQLHVSKMPYLPKPSKGQEIKSI